jgi:hypothetical protein
VAVTVKTVKKKKALSLKKGGAPAGAPADGEAVEGAPAVAAAAPAKRSKPVKKASYTFAGVCAILELLMFIAILTLQILEWKHYDAPPKGAFPNFGIELGDIPVPGGSSQSNVPVAEEVDDMGDDLADSDDFLGEEEVSADDELGEEAVPAE